ncbi:MAG: LytTR family DNA-binding domain-containing protein [Oscillospiraceae bacterium]|nr:LytTR family DNA-binding domain-containing protein [Oscillospiraceae bacterium]
MLSIAVCDDEILLQHTLIAKVNDYLNRNRLDGKATGFSRGEDIVSKSNSFDILLLDIEMSGINGMQTAVELREQGKDCQIIFVTSHSSYVYDAFNVDASNFLVKPVTDEKLFSAMDKAVRRVHKNSDSSFLLVKKGNDILKLRFCDILFCESINHKIVIHTENGITDYYESIATLEKKLDSDFFRCHRSYIINLKRVASYEKDTIIFDNGTHALVSRRKANELTQKLLDAIRNEVV